MKYRDVFHLISSVCKKNNVSCVLIGGFAVNYYKVSRQTADADFLITKDGFKKIIGLLKKEGLKQEYAGGVFARFSSEEPYFMDFDFMFVDKVTLDKIIRDGKSVEIAERKFIVPSLSHLIALKLHAIKYNPKTRELKDFLDIADLIKANKVDAKAPEFKELCLKYGTEELYQKILSWL